MSKGEKTNQISNGDEKRSVTLQRRVNKHSTCAQFYLYF